MGRRSRGQALAHSLSELQYPDGLNYINGLPDSTMRGYPGIESRPCDAPEDRSVCPSLRNLSPSTHDLEKRSHMWTFETDPDYQADLDWADAFVREEIEPLDFVIPHVLDISDPVRQGIIPPLQARVRERGLWRLTSDRNLEAKATGR
jgi:hypothetical protein